VQIALRQFRISGAIDGKEPDKHSAAKARLAGLKKPAKRRVRLRDCTHVFTALEFTGHHLALECRVLARRATKACPPCRRAPRSSRPLINSDQGLGDETGEGTDFIVVTR